MSTKTAISFLMIFAGSVASAEEKVSPHQSPEKDTVSVNVTVPTSDAALQRLGVKSLKGVDVDRMATYLSLLSAARTGGAAEDRTTRARLKSNSCVCHGWLDCVLAMDECKTPPKDPDGKLCTGGAPCTCTWH